jgi:hypothetical protein
MSNFKTLGIVSKAVLFLFVAALSSTFLAPAAQADVMYSFTTDGCTGGCGPQDSFGTVVLHQVDPTTVDISVSLLNGNTFVSTGSHTGLAFNFLGPDVTVGDLPDGWSDVGPNITEPAFGMFAHGITCDLGNANNKRGCSGSNPWAGDLEFEVSRASGLAVTDFQTNGGGYTFAANILSGINGKSGLVAAGTEVPEPATLVMLGSGVLSLAAMLRNKFRG